MTTEQIIWIVVIVVAALALIGLIVSSMRKRMQQDNRARAAEIREQAGTKAAVIPEAEARARAEEARAEEVRLKAERAEERAREARGALAQEEALHEDRIRAADRLDPDVDHKAKDYTPGTHAAERTEPESADPHPSGASTGTHAAERTQPVTPTTSDPATIGDSRDSASRDSDTASSETTTTTPGRRVDPDAAPEPDWTDPDQRDGTTGGTTGGSHRA